MVKQDQNHKQLSTKNQKEQSTKEKEQKSHSQKKGEKFKKQDTLHDFDRNEGEQRSQKS